MGISIADIRQIIEGGLSLEEVMQMRLSSIEEEKKQLSFVVILILLGTVTMTTKEVEGSLLLFFT